jgi:hypothetical protein
MSKNPITAFPQGEEFTRQVLRNCAISDARHAGNYSLCGLALRLRDLYKWEKGLEPWIEEDAAVMLDWIGRKEEEWEGLMESDFEPLGLHGETFQPFAVDEINALIEPLGFCYGAGYVHGLKPAFFLAPLREEMQIQGLRVSILGRELARDLLTLPALTQQERIFVRKDAASLFLWNQIFFLKKSGREGLRFALKAYGVDDPHGEELRQKLDRISEDELGTYVHHEIGEIRDPVFDRDLWRKILSSFPRTPVEILVRSLKDVLADTGEYGTLRYIIQERRGSSLGFYAAFLDGLKKELMPALPGAFRAFCDSGDWSLVEEAVSSTYDRARSHANTVIRLFQEGESDGDLRRVQTEIEREVFQKIVAPKSA